MNLIRIITLSCLLTFSFKSANAQVGTVQDRWLLCGGAPAYFGAGWVRFGDIAGIGFNIQTTAGTWMNVFQSEKYEMGESRIYDNGRYSWKYDNKYEHDRGFITARLYLTMYREDFSTHLMYFGIGPGWSRDLFGFRRAGADGVVYVGDKVTLINATELEIGYLYDIGGFGLAIGLSAINASKSAQITFGIAFDFDDL